MVITYDPETKTVTMNLADLVHCGFDHDEFRDALFIDGLDDTIVPEKLVVDFSATVVDCQRLIINDRYCECRCCVPYVVSTDEVRCQLCGKIIRCNITIGSTGG